MAIVPLQKFSLYGALEQKQSVIDCLQDLGCTHLIDSRADRPDQPELTSREARQTLSFLNASPVKRRPSRRRDGYDRHEVTRQAREIMNRSEELIQTRDQLQGSIAQRKPWGEFAVPAPVLLGGLRLWFYEIDPKQVSELPENLQWTVVTEDHDLVRLIVVSPTSPKQMPVDPLEIAQESIDELHRQLEDVEEELDELFWQRVELTRWRELMQQDLDMADDETARESAARRLWENRSLFVLQGWIPETRLDDLKQSAEEQQLALSCSAPAETDEPPTLLENSPVVHGSETCLTFYQMPGYHTWDPTFIVFFSLCIFFAMIVSDAGYGLIMGAIFLSLYRSLKRSPNLSKLRNLFLGIIFCTIAYGVLIGSYFGLSPGPDSWLSRLQVTHGGKPIVQNQQVMMLVSVGVGVLHLTLANLMSAWSHRRSSRSLGSIGWALMITGAYWYGMNEFFEQTEMNQSVLGLILAGALCVLLFSSRLPLATVNPLIHLRRLGAGIFQFSSIPKAFGDTLSYLRLFALGLASSQLALTFNDLAANLSHESGVGVLLALIVLILGHAINFLLGLMGGVVHGLRLNCIEFLGWSLDHDGYSFRPFRKKATS